MRADSQLSYSFIRLRGFNFAVRLDAVFDLALGMIVNLNGVQSFERMALLRHRLLTKDA